MNTNNVLLVFSFAFLVSTINAKLNIQKKPRAIGGRIKALQTTTSQQPSTLNCTWKYFTQPLDHFSPGVTTTEENEKEGKLQ